MVAKLLPLCTYSVTLSLYEAMAGEPALTPTGV